MDYMELFSRHQAKCFELEDTQKAIAELVRVIELTNPIDDHGHPLKNSLAYLAAKEFVGKKSEDTLK